MVASDGALPLPWPAEPLRHALGSGAHALLLHGPRGVGQFELAITLAQAWLCEGAASDSPRPCGRCAACRLVQAHSHPDLLVLLPEALREPLGWAAVDDDGATTERASKKQPSKDIRVDEVRAAIAFSQTTSARGRLKVVVFHPAERMNAIAANALLKTLEEPPGDTRLVLSGSTIDALPATVRSRCQRVAIALPAPDQAIAWLTAQGVSDAAVLLAATGGQPQLALDWSREGVDAAGWKRLPGAIAQGSAAPLTGWPVPRAVDALLKLCHDALCVGAGAAPRYFPPEAFAPARTDSAALRSWQRELMRIARHAEHPWSAPLLIDALVQQGTRALAGSESAAARPRSGPIHSAA